MYVTTEDIQKWVADDDLSVINEQQDEIIADAEEFVRDSLNHIYDIDQEYAKVGRERKSTLVNLICHIAIFNMHQKVSPRNIPETRGLNYEEAVRQLKEIEKGSLLSDLPKQADEEKQKGTGKPVYGFSSYTNQIY
jgi:phage gp36-like protein